MINWLKTRFSRETAPSNTEGQFSLGDTELRVIVSPQEARAELERVLLKLEYNKASFQAKDLIEVLENTGKSRAWLHAQIKRMLDEQRIWFDDSLNTGPRYVFLNTEDVTESN